jgi:hypothetical protein
MVKKSVLAFGTFSTIPAGQIASFPNAYSVSLPSNPKYIQHVGTINRTTVKFDTGNTFLGSTPVANWTRMC